jgi:hypothetical protein
LAESSKEGYGTKMAILTMMMIPPCFMLEIGFVMIELERTLEAHNMISL